MKMLDQIEAQKKPEKPGDEHKQTKKLEIII